MVAMSPGIVLTLDIAIIKRKQTNKQKNKHSEKHSDQLVFETNPYSGASQKSDEDTFAHLQMSGDVTHWAT